MSINDKATPTNYELAFPKLPSGVASSLTESKELVLHIFGTVLPGLMVTPIEGQWLGATAQIGGVIEFNEWNFNFIVDEELNNWWILFKWITKIANKKDVFAGNSYDIDASLRILDNYKNTVAKVKFIDVWPKGLGDVILSYREGESILESSCDLSFLRFEIEKV